MKRTYYLSVIVASTLVMLGAVQFCRAEQPGYTGQPEYKEDAAPKKTPLPKSGTLSTTVSSGAANNKVPPSWGEESVFSDEQAPVSGSVSRMGPDTWMMKVFNNSKDTYSVSLGIIQRDGRGNQVKSDSVSYTLKAGQSQTKNFSASPNSASASLELRSYTNISERKRDREKKTEGSSSGADASASGVISNQ